MRDNPSPPAPQLPIKLKKVAQRKTASAQIRGAAIEVILPQHWPKESQNEIAHQLAQRLQHQFVRDFDLLERSLSPRISFEDKDTFHDWVTDLNHRTLRVPVKGVRIGYSKYTHLAQMNLKNHVMTVSRHCLNDVPESALHYLVIHELAHLKVANHSPAFWSEVKRFVPDVKHQRRLIQAVHRVRIYESSILQVDEDNSLSANLEPRSLKKIPKKELLQKPESLLKQLLLRLF